MRSRRRATIEDLRLAIACLPRRTRLAMLEGLDANEIIVGAYATTDGICPMLAAHRAGGRTSLVSFAEAWDRVAFRGDRRPRARPATRRELLILRAHLEASLLEDEPPLGAAAGTGAARAADPATPQPGLGDPADSRRRRGDPARPGPRPGDPARARELRDRPGWAWSRLVRRYDDYERLLRRLDETVEAHGQAHGQPEPPAHGRDADVPGRAKDPVAP